MIDSKTERGIVALIVVMLVSAFFLGVIVGWVAG